MKHFILAFFALSLAGCSSLGGGSSKTRSEDLIEQAKKNCELLGFEPNTKQYLDCTTSQFNKAQERYYGPLQ